MKTKNKLLLTALSCLIIGAVAYFAWMFPFYEFENNSYDTSFAKLFSLEYLKTLVPLFLIAVFSAIGIAAILWLRRLMLKTDRNYARFADRRRKSAKAPKQSLSRS